MLIYIRIAGAWLARRWIISTVLLFALLMAYTSSPIFGQSPPPTPDIQTVPVPAMVATPTNTPFPTATAVVIEIPQVPSPAPAVTPSKNQDKNQDGADDTTDNTGKTGDNATGGATSGGATGDSSTGGGAAGGNEQTTNPQGVGQTTGTLTNTLTGTVVITVLNIRKGPSTANAIIDTLFRNDKVQILARSADGLWWLVCCGADTKHQGWVTAQFVRPNFDVAQAAARLPIGAGSSAAPATNAVNKNAPVPGITKALTLATGMRITPTVPVTTSTAITPGLKQSDGATLQFQIRPSPAFVWQGQIVNLQFIVTNVGQATANNVRLRDDLPATLRYTQAVASHNGQIQQTSKAQGGSIVSLAWPQVAAGATVTATVTLQIMPNLPDGSLIDNLAVVAADNVGDIPAGITLAMPPTLMPVFK